MPSIMNKAELAAALAEDKGAEAPVEHRYRFDAEDIMLIDRATHCCLGTVDAKGRQCLSLVSGGAGLVRMVDECSILMPEEAEQAEALSHILEEPGVTLLLFAPGEAGELHIRGKASITNDPRLMAHVTAAGQSPDVALFIEVTEVSRRGEAGQIQTS